MNQKRGHNWLETGFCQLLLTVWLVILSSCTPDGRHKPVTPVTEPPGKTSVSFETVRPIFVKNCSSCHPDKSAPDWTKKENALEYVKNGKLWKRVVDEEDMPQLGSPESQQFTPEDRGAIRQWIQAIRSGSGPEPEPFPQGPFEAIEKCINCHGLLGDSQKVGVPYLAEQNEPYLRAQLADFKSGKRPDLVLDSMGAIVSVLTEEEINLVVKYYSRLRSQPPFPQQEIPDLEKKLARGEELSEQMACTGCHAAINNRAAMPQWPNLAGQKRDYIFNQLRAFRDGQRPGATMPGLLESQDPPFSDEDLDSMAIYFSRLGLTPQ